VVPLTLVIIAKDEADRIGRAIRSVPCAAEVLVLDSGSTDDTVAVAEALGARVIETDWPGFGPQKNRAWQAAAQPWVLSLDADEWLDATAAAAVEACVLADKSGGFRLWRHNRWCGRPVRGGAWGPSLKLRLARKGDARWTAAQVHEHLVAEGPATTLAGTLQHDPFREPAEHLAQVAGYATLFVAESRRIGRGRSAVALLTRPCLHIVKALLLRGGWRDGVLGLQLAWLGAAEVALKWALLWSDGGKSQVGTGLAPELD
jgi:glycosyltransferase involved in cell wall biosynthesis